MASSQIKSSSKLTRDSAREQTLSDVIVIAQVNLTNKKTKVLSSLDGYLESNPSINMVKRGAYAWEPLLNGMAIERSVVTIDGMRIYGACTDKMDPVTSYVEITNLSKADVHSGQSGAANGATIAGSIDLVRRKSGFNNTGFKGSLFTGFEGSNQQKIAGLTLQYATNKYFTDMDFTIRDAENYSAGGGKEILYSGFTKYNMSLTSGFKINEHQQLSASIIYDKATNIGYPALPMDVSMAEAFIGSLQYNIHGISSLMEHWESKIYYNSVTHNMDDSKRPDVKVRMDMPGWSKTAGYYSKFMGNNNRHSWTANVSGHFNHSIAEMTMYANQQGEKDMYMLTWPGVNTFYQGIFLEDNIVLNKNLQTNVSVGTGININKIESDFGFENLGIFYPGLKRNKIRLIKNISSKLIYKHTNWQYSLGLGYGERSPGVSEGYGLYLFNSFDGYDYIGNPFLKNEKSLEANMQISFSKTNFSIKAQLDYFKIHNYIIGTIQSAYLPMAIGANGVKIYQQLSNASILNSSLSFSYQLFKRIQLEGKSIYRLGKSGNLTLPQIQPLSYGTTLRYSGKKIILETVMEGALAQTSFSREYGESPSKDYTIFNLSASKQFVFRKNRFSLKGGIENIFDRYYSTFADWNHIPRMGRNIFINIIYALP